MANLPDVSTPFLVRLESENQAPVIYSSEQSVESRNFQRALASLFIFKQENGQFDEQDLLGTCLTTYDQDHHGLHKVKETCQSGPEGDQKVMFVLLKFKSTLMAAGLESDLFCLHFE